MEAFRNYEAFAARFSLLAAKRFKAVEGRIRYLRRQGDGSGEDMHLRKLIRRDLCLAPSSPLDEEYLCALWKHKGVPQMKYWTMSRLYRRYLSEGTAAVLSDIIYCHINSNPTVPAYRYPDSVRFSQTALTTQNYENLRHHFVLQLIPPKIAEARTNSYFCKSLEHLAVAVYRLERTAILSRNPRLIPLRRTDLRGFRIPESTIFRDALTNTRNLMPPRIFQEEQIAHLDFRKEGIFMEEDAASPEDIRALSPTRGRTGFRLTTRCWTGGAVAALYPHVLNTLSSMFNDDLLITFPDANEARIHPASQICPTEARNALQQYHAQIPPCEQLSDGVYFFSKVRKELHEIEFYEW